MANNCYFQMKIAGEERNVFEFIEMLRWEGRFARSGLGRVFSFDTDMTTLERSSVNDSQIAIIGSGDCANSVRTSMLYEKQGVPCLESETKRLGLAVELYSSEKGCAFQEHYLISRGMILIQECTDYHEHCVEGASESELAYLCEEYQLTKEELMQRVDVNGDFTVGGFGERFGDYSALHRFCKPIPSLSQNPSSFPSLDQQISAAEQTLAGNLRPEGPSQVPKAPVR